MKKKSSSLLAGSSLVLTQLMASGLPSQNVSASFWKYLNPFSWPSLFAALWEKIFVTEVVSKPANLKSIIERPGKVEEKENSASAVGKLPKKQEENKISKQSSTVIVNKNVAQGEFSIVKNNGEKSINKAGKGTLIDFGNPPKKETSINKKSEEEKIEKILDFDQAVKLLEKEYPENFKYDFKKKSIYGEYTGNVSANGDLKLSVSIECIDPNLNDGKRYRAEFFGRKFYFKTDEDLFKYVEKHVDYRRKLEKYIEKFKEVEATGKFTLKVVKTEEGYYGKHKIVLKIVDWSNLRFKERKGSCVSGLEIVLDHYENEPVVVECYNAYKTVTPFYVSYDDGVNVHSDNYAFSRPKNKELLYNLFEDLLKSIEDYNKQYVERAKESFEAVFCEKIKWEKMENEGKLKGTFEIDGFKFPVEIVASKGPDNYGTICGKRFLGNYLPSSKELKEWILTSKYLFEECYNKFKMCEKGGNFKVIVKEKNVIVLESKNKKSINVPGILLGSYYHRDDNKWLHKEDTVAVNKVELDALNREIIIYSSKGREYRYQLGDFGAWHLCSNPDDPFEIRFNKFFDHLVSEVEEMYARAEKSKNKDVNSSKVPDQVGRLIYNDDKNQKANNIKDNYVNGSNGDNVEDDGREYINEDDDDTNNDDDHYGGNYGEYSSAIDRY